jgi:hypothetical protein
MHDTTKVDTNLLMRWFCFNVFEILSIKGPICFFAFSWPKLQQVCFFELDPMCALSPFNYIVIICHCKHNYPNCDLVHAQLPPFTFTKINAMINNQISFEKSYKVVNV